MTDSIQQRRKYRHSPIEEAICEFRFASSSDWDASIPDKLQGFLQNEYPRTPKEEKMVQVGLQVHEGKPANLQYTEKMAKIRLADEHGKRKVCVGPDVLSIHMLRPYQNPLNSELGGWEEFGSRIEDALSAYRQIVNSVGVLKVGVRYINKLEIPEVNVRIEDYLKNIRLEFEGLPKHYSNFWSRVEYVYEDDTNVLAILTYGLLSATRIGVECLLDIDLIWNHNETPIEIEAAQQVSYDLHKRAGSVFEAVITDKARELFNVN